jgi:hypothetical protein
MAFPHIKKFIREGINYPSKKVVYVEKVSVQDDKFVYYEAFVGKEEAELIKFIKFNLKNKLSSSEIDKLWDLIEEYGSERYSDGRDDADMDNAGADL